MTSRFNFILSLIVLYFVCVKCNDENSLYTFDSQVNVSIGQIKQIPQIECSPKNFCEKADLSVNYTVNCTGNFLKEELKNWKFDCKHGKLNETKFTEKWNATFEIDCLRKIDLKNDNPKEELEKSDKPKHELKDCWLKVSLKKAEKKDNESNIGKIVGVIVILVVLAAIVTTVLGCLGKGPMKNLFRS